jgi:hypothetical protein
MIDTIKLTLGRGMFTISDKTLFQKETMNAVQGFFKLVQNPTKTELKRGIYKPRLTLTKRYNYSGRFEPTLTIELSLPKLIYGNNFDELEDSDFEKVVQSLKLKLREMGIYVFEYVLINAPVSAIHYGKNIPLTDYTTPYMYLKMLSKANINQRLDLNQTDFRNEGHSLKFRANSFEVIFYDKLKDLNKAKISEKRTEEKDNTLQLNLFEEILIVKPFEVLRMEVRLNKRQKIIQILKQTGIITEITFQNLFKKDIAQKVLLYYIDEIEAGYPKILLYKSNNTKGLLAEIKIYNPKIGLLKALQLCKIKELIEEVGIREFREITKIYGRTNWYNLNKELKGLNNPKVLNPFSTIRTALTAFEPLKLIAFKGKMLNNDKYN